MVSCFHAFLASACELIHRRGGSIVRPGEVDPRLVPILADLSSSPRIGPLPYETWRTKVGVGREQIDRLARQHLGMTLHAWRNRQLEREVRRRLISGSTAIKAVASELGFVDPAHFNRWCRQHLHLRPGQLRGGAA
jgi:transcriptional regulator GlxA family with amidase domain